MLNRTAVALCPGPMELKAPRVEEVDRVFRAKRHLIRFRIVGDCR